MKKSYSPIVTFSDQLTAKLLVFSSVAPRQFALDNRKEAFLPIKRLSVSATATDAAAFHLVLASAASEMTLLKGVMNLRSEISHKTEALKIINKRMADISLATSDKNIGAVVMFAGCEVRLL